MELADNDLLDLLLRRREEAEVPLDGETRKVLEMLRVPRSAEGAGDRTAASIEVAQST